MSYVIQELNGEKCIIELQTDNKIKLSKNKTETEFRTITRKLNLGSGFNGWTPDFFTKSMKCPYSADIFVDI